MAESSNSTAGRKIRRAVRKTCRETGHGEPVPGPVITSEDRESIIESTRIFANLENIFKGITTDTSTEAVKSEVTSTLMDVTSKTGEPIVLTSEHAYSTVVVTGRGGHLECKGPYHRFIVKGFVESLTRAGEGDLFAIVDINGNITHRGSGHVVLKSKIGGNVVHAGVGFLALIGNVSGSILQKGKNSAASIHIEGDINGQIVQDGGSSVMVKGNVNGDILQHGDGSIIVQGSHNGKVIKPSGSRGGTVKIFDGNRISMFL